MNVIESWPDIPFIFAWNNSNQTKIHVEKSHWTNATQIDWHRKKFQTYKMPEKHTSHRRKSKTKIIRQNETGHNVIDTLPHIQNVWEQNAKRPKCCRRKWTTENITGKTSQSQNTREENAIQTKYHRAKHQKYKMPQGKNATRMKCQKTNCHKIKWCMDKMS